MAAAPDDSSHAKPSAVTEDAITAKNDSQDGQVVAAEAPRASIEVSSKRQSLSDIFTIVSHSLSQSPLSFSYPKLEQV